MSQLDEPLRLTLSREMTEKVRERMHSLGFTNPEDVIEESFAALDSRDANFERFLVEEAIPALEEYDRDPSTGLTSQQLKQRLDAEYGRLAEAS